MTRGAVLVIEDDPDIASVLVDYLRRDGFQATHSSDGRQGLALAQRIRPDLVLLDVMLPGLDGMEILKAIRRDGETPVIMITARVEEVDRLLGLAMGADDYVCKPFSPREVLARVNAVLRRTRAGGAPPRTPLLLLDPARRQATLRGQPLELTRTEFELLQVLAKQPGRIYSRAQLLELAWPDSLDTSERAIDSHVKNLRKKFAAVDPAHEWIRAVYGVGFALESAEDGAA
ncbi:response regulator [Caenimonas aquaedulcis]|uniref:Response regulator n=1 Tax=Caenimonas aquaedulcis TaxID=2793270 RepID=A0A931H5C6_9BURK|nr:response regulator [Caenimonas aquaedulcis]MBG9388944.1 response regulator [Caenimonas aquaedulcis]